MDWLQFFDDHQIDYVTRGPNVKKDNVNIACPFCGDDPSHHMGVSLLDKGYGCWRSANHAGKKSNGLIRALLNCSFNQAKILAQQYSAADPESLDEAIAALMAGEQADKRPDRATELRFRGEFSPIKAKGSTSRFYSYLERRGFGDGTADLCKLYNLRCANTGRFKDRVIIPIYQGGKLVSWTSRAIGKNVEAARYLALSEDQGGLVNVFHTIWNWDELKHGGDLLIIVEGPFDALKVDFYGWELNTCATCTFGTAMSEEQAMMIAEVAKGFEKAVLLYDAGATESIFRAKGLLEHTKVECGFLPPDVEDPGEMSRKQVRKFIRGYLK